MTEILVLAKCPRPGHVKTRLTPPLSPDQAAAVAAAALADTLDAVAATPVARRVAVLDGPPGAWLPDGFEVVRQRDGGLDARLAGAFLDAGAPALLIGMDTPQVTASLLLEAVDTLARPGVDAVLGPARDGGFWSVGLRRPCADAFVGVPMNTPWTGTAQADRLRRLGLWVAELPTLDDVDDMTSAHRVAALAAGTRFARTLRRFAA